MEGERLLLVVAVLAQYAVATSGQCPGGLSSSFARWSAAAPERATPVFVYAASGDEGSLAGACVARCRELAECAGVVVDYARAHCQGVARQEEELLRPDNDVAYFKKICVQLPDGCAERWWSVESTPGYNLHSEGGNLKMVLNTTARECYAAVLAAPQDQLYRSAQWVSPAGVAEADSVATSEAAVGSCVLNTEDKFTEPESYRVSNYYTFYIENQCRHDYPKKIDRCSYEEYYNQTLKHVEYTFKNYTKDECKNACEVESRFVCRGFTWQATAGEAGEGARGARGLCDLHSEDLVSTGSWLLRRATQAVYYRRVICLNSCWCGRSGEAGEEALGARGLCDLNSEDLVSTGSWLLRRAAQAVYYRRVISLNITVECEGSELVVTYRPRGRFRGRVYVPGRGERCGARGAGADVRLALPLRGDCDVNFAHAISHTPAGLVNRTMAYVMVMIQNNPIIQTAGDRWVRVGCAPGRAAPAPVHAAVAVSDTGRPSAPSGPSAAPAPAAASTVLGGGAPVSMYVVRADHAAAAAAGAGAAAVSLGEPLELRIDTAETREMEAYHLVASSRLGDSSVLLLDSRGCPTGQVDFPGFTRSTVGGTQRLSARFKAFRFPASHVVRFALMLRFCDLKCEPVKCITPQARSARQTNSSIDWGSGSVPAAVSPVAPGWGGVVAQGGPAPCGERGRLPLEVEVVVGAGDVVSADTMVRADHRSNLPEETLAAGAAGAAAAGEGLVCVHELLLLALALAWLAVQLLLLLGCCVLVKRYRSLAELSMQKEYQSFDNVGFDTVSTHRRVHWPDQNTDVLHGG